MSAGFKVLSVVLVFVVCGLGRASADSLQWINERKDGSHRQGTPARPSSKKPSFKRRTHDLSYRPSHVVKPKGGKNNQHKPSKPPQPPANHTPRTNVPGNDTTAGSTPGNHTTGNNSPGNSIPGTNTGGNSNLGSLSNQGGGLLGQGGNTAGTYGHDWLIPATIPDSGLIGQCGPGETERHTVPEPQTLILLISGLLSGGALLRRRQRS